MRSIAAAVAVAVVVSVALVACNIAGAGIKGNGKAQTAQRAVPGFRALSVSGAIDVRVVVGGRQSVELRGDENVLPIIRTRVTNDTLVVDSTESYSSKVPLELRITVPALEALSASGACRGSIQGITGESFTLDASGATSFELAGATDRLRLDVSGSGTVGARRLVAASATVGVSGAGEIELTATSHLAASVSGAGSIDYWGNPGRVERSVSGAGSIEGH
ncbi:MAG: DUF2807 domain-containing protein [Deltaproteobacteria bacterium]|nr:DUF2807 domain-containing protein [Kofleriaceae bacterium]